MTTPKKADSSQGPTKKVSKREAAFPSEKELFSSLTDSAFEFLETAIDGLLASPKFSTVHFAIAIELFLKARLMREHWSLLLDKPDQGDKAAFFKGEAKTVSPEQALQRLKKIAVVQVPQSSSDIFLKIAQHRNKMVHFVHVGETDDQGREEIVSEQLEGWMALRALLEEWDEFRGYRSRIRHINRKMEGHRGFLQKKFEAKKCELQAHTDAGMHISSCPMCKFQSVKVENSASAIASASCVVCSYRGSEITLTCDDCGAKIRCNSYDGRPDCCPTCDSSISRDQVEEKLNTGEPVTPDNYFDHTPINCPSCTGMGTVVEHYEIYVCTECFSTDSDYGICGHCSEGQLGGVPEDSAFVGCEFCDGSAARYRDD